MCLLVCGNLITHRPSFILKKAADKQTIKKQTISAEIIKILQLDFDTGQTQDRSSSLETVVATVSLWGSLLL